MKLVYKSTQKEVKVGDAFDHNERDGAVERLIVVGIEKPRHGGSTGRVYASADGKPNAPGYYPSVYGMEWVERDDQQGGGAMLTEVCHPAE